jgi:hypothetical protein
MRLLPSVSHPLRIHTNVVMGYQRRHGKAYRSLSYEATRAERMSATKRSVAFRTLQLRAVSEAEGLHERGVGTPYIAVHVELAIRYLEFG